MAEAGSKRRPSEVRCFRNWGLHVDVEDSRSEDSYEFGKGNSQVLRSSANERKHQ